MALNIKDRKTEELARALKKQTGESLTVATRRALEERLRRTARPPRADMLIEDLKAIERQLAALPVLDHRTPEEIIGYDENGVPR